jgi:dTDP-4-dehydrorhamnose reductase
MIWLIGNKGMLGTEVALALEQRGMEFIGTDREVDITDPSALAAFAESVNQGHERIKWIVNCAAYTAVDKAEDDADTCRRLNTDGPANISALAPKLYAACVHVSTDYVYNGKATKPYYELDDTDPIGVYGLTKRDGELRIEENTYAAYIVRTSWLYSKYGNNFVKTMLKLMRERDSISVVNDQRGSPTWARDLAETIYKLIDSVEHPIWFAIKSQSFPFFGTYHYTNAGDTTWFEFACAIYEKGRALGLLTKDCEIKPCTSAEYPQKVKRPAYSVLEKSRIRNELCVMIPSWQESLDKFLTELANENAQ